MVSTKLLDVQPPGLKFTFELKKQSSCAIKLVNISDQYVAFKVKTTSPKKYCVRPNTGIIKPNSNCDFTVTLQAQRSAPSDRQCRDKFLIQSTSVPFGTTEEDMMPGMFAKDGGKYIEESKLSVMLISPPHSPVLLPVNGVMKQEPSNGTSIQNDNLLDGVENLPPTVSAKDVKSALAAEESRLVKDVHFSPFKDVKPRPVHNLEDSELKFDDNIVDLKSKLNVLESKLREADFTIKRLTEERKTNIQDKEMLKQELAMLRSEGGVRRVYKGFPFLFVCMVALIGLMVGYLLRP